MITAAPCLHTCNDVNPTTVDECLACAVEQGLCTEFIAGRPETFCKQPQDHPEPHDFEGRWLEQTRGGRR